MGLPTYSVGTASVANGNQSVSFAGGAALTSVDPTTGATLAVCGPGDFLVVAGSGGAFGVIQTVVDATHVTLETPWAGSTNATAAYKIYRQSVPLTGSAAALAQTVLNQGSDSQPDLSRTIDSGVARLKARIGTDGKAKLSVGATGTADASLLDGISIDPATGAASFPNGMKEYVLGFRNRLINGSFDIWQRGTSFSIGNTASQYVADRWLGGNVFGVTATYAKIAAPTGFRGRSAINITATGVTVNGFADVWQRLEGQMLADLDSQACALSFDINATTSAGSLTGQVYLGVNTGLDNGTFSALVGPIAYTVPVGSGKVIVPLSAAQTAGIKNGVQLYIRVTQITATGNVNISLGSVQLEKGAVANDFEFRPLSVELALAHRYFRRFAYPPLRGVYNGTSGARMGMALSPPMRAAPTLAIGSSLQVYNGITATTSNTVLTNYSTADEVECDLTLAATTGYAGGNAVVVFAGAGFLDVIAEL